MQMKRNALQRLINWKADEERKPMVLKGARQVGKTWLKKYIDKYSPKHALRFSKRGYRTDGNITNVPLYLAGKIREML